MTAPPKDLAGLVLAAARAAGCREAEIVIKTSSVRQLGWEPPLRPDAGAHVAVSRLAESGAGLRVTDAGGRAGLAWRGGGPSLVEDPCAAAAEELLATALAAARAGAAATGAGAGAAATGAVSADGTVAADPVAAHVAAPGPVAGDAAAEGAAATGNTGVGNAAAAPGAAATAMDAAAGAVVPPAGEWLDLVDPLCLERPDAVLAALAETVVAEVAAAGEGAVDVDRIVMTEALTSVRLARLSGFDGAYRRTVAALSIALVPAVHGAEAVTEDRTACRLDDIDVRRAAREAVLRALPPRSAEPGGAPPPAGEGAMAKPRVLLAPRAAATLVAALAPWVTAGAFAPTRRSALSILDDGAARGRPGSAPFDGSGAPTGQRLLLDRGRSVARIGPDVGPFQRPSYRDLPLAAPAGLIVLPGQRRPRRGSAGGAADRAPEDHAAPAEGATAGGGASAGDRASGAGGPPSLRAEVVEVRGGRTWVVQVRRGQWSSGAPADGLFWEGPPEALIQGIAGTLDDLAWFQVGIAIATPSVLIEGLGPWRLPGG